MVMVVKCDGQRRDVLQRKDKKVKDVEKKRGGGGGGKSHGSVSEATNGGR